MTEEETTSPRTMRDVLVRLIDANAGLTLNGIEEAWDGMDVIEREAAAATPSLDATNSYAQMLREYLSQQHVYTDHVAQLLDAALIESRSTPDMPTLAKALGNTILSIDHDPVELYAEKVAAEYARLDEGIAAPLDSHDLPGHKSHECRICGNWTEGSATPEQKR